VGPVAGTAPQPPAAPQPAMPAGGFEVPKTPQSIEAGQRVNALATQLQQAVKDGRTAGEVAEIRRQLQSAVNALRRMGQ
jgi:hypothetical protein